MAKLFSFEAIFSWKLLCLVIIVYWILEVNNYHRQGGPCDEELEDIAAFPGEKAYLDGSKIHNSAYTDVQPAFIAFPQSPEDVQRCLQCSDKHAVPCVVKSGGHSSAGYSTIHSSGFVISLAKMKDITVQGDTALIQAGATWADIYDRLNATTQLITGGVCPTVGVAGFTLGGGYGILNRKYGLAIDNVLSMTMITANGDRVVVANSTSNTELFWALRGGGGGNFGIVTDFTFKTHSAANYSRYVLKVLHFEAGFKSQEALSLVGELDPQLPHEVYFKVMLLFSRELEVLLIVLGNLDGALDHLLAPLIHLAENVNLINYENYYDLASQVASLNDPTRVISGDYEAIQGCVIETINREVVSTFFKSFEAPPGCLAVFPHLGGVIQEVKPDETAYYYRNATFTCYVLCKYDGTEYEDTMHAVQDKVFSAMEQGGHCIGNYINDMNRRLQGWKKKYYGGNYPRLLEIKNKWHPVSSGYFHFPQEIGSNYSY